jgi:hypothetical protein
MLLLLSFPLPCCYLLLTPSPPPSPSKYKRGALVAVVHVSAGLSAEARLALAEQDRIRRACSGLRVLAGLLQQLPSERGFRRPSMQSMQTLTHSVPSVPVGGAGGAGVSASPGSVPGLDEAVLSALQRRAVPVSSPLHSDAGRNAQIASVFGEQALICPGLQMLPAGKTQSPKSLKQLQRLEGLAVEGGAQAQVQARHFWKPILQQQTSASCASSPSSGKSHASLFLSGASGLELSTDSFPLLLLSYVDLLEMSDAVAFLAAQMPQAVLVFAPDFLLGECIVPYAVCLMPYAWV